MQYQIYYGDEFLDDLDFIEVFLEEETDRNWLALKDQLKKEIKKSIETLLALQELVNILLFLHIIIVSVTFTPSP